MKPLKLSQIHEINDFRAISRTDGRVRKRGRMLRYASTEFELPEVGSVLVTVSERQKAAGGPFNEVEVDTDTGSSVWTAEDSWSVPLHELGLSPGDIQAAADQATATLKLGSSSIDMAGIAADMPGSPAVVLVSVCRGRGGPSGKAGGTISLFVDGAEISAHIIGAQLNKIYCNHHSMDVHGWWDAKTRTWSYCDPTTWDELPAGTTPDICGWKEDYFPLVEALAAEMNFKR